MVSLASASTNRSFTYKNRVQILFSPPFIMKMHGPQISSANRKSSKSRLNLLRFADLPRSILRICDLRTIYFLRLADLRFADPLFSADLKLPQIHYLFPHKNISLKCFHSNLRTTFGFWYSYYMAFRSLKYRYRTIIVLKNIRGKLMRIWIRNTDVFLANLRVSVWARDTKEICGFTISD